MNKSRTATGKPTTSKKAKLVLEEDKKKEEETSGSSGEEDVEENQQKEDEEEPFDMGQMDNLMLNCILEKLTVKETMTLMSTSKAMMSFYESKAKFKIPFEYHQLEYFSRGNGQACFMQRNPYPYCHFGMRLLMKSDSFRRELQKLPFRFYLHRLRFCDKVTPAAGEALKRRIELLKIEFIDRVSLGSATDPEDLEILERSLGTVFIRDEISLFGAHPSLVDFHFVRRHALDICSAHGSLIEHMKTIQNAKLKFEMNYEETNNEIEAAIEVVIEKWSNCPSSLEMWDISIKFAYGSTSKREPFEAFMRALDKRNPVDFNTRGPLPSHRPLYFIKEDENGENAQRKTYYIAREDGSIVHGSID